MQEKRGISSLVATILIILIVVVAVGIIWSALRPIISNSTSLTQACSQASLMVNSQQGYTCYDESSNEVLIMISRTGESEIAGAQLVLTSGSESRAFDLEQGKSYTNLRMYYQPDYGLPVQVPKTNEDIAYAIDATELGTVTNAKLAPIVKVGISQKRCSVSSKVYLEKCAARSEVLFDTMDITPEV